jgi:hypothetical protein
MGMSGRGRMPRLHPPQGVTLEPQGGGRWNSEVRVETDRSVADLEAHFASQLVEAGWTRLLWPHRRRGRLELLPRSLGEGEWRGLLVVLAAFGDQERSLTLRRDQPRGRGIGGSRVYLQFDHLPALTARRSPQVSFPNTGPPQYVNFTPEAPSSATSSGALSGRVPSQSTPAGGRHRR